MKHVIVTSLAILVGVFASTVAGGSNITVIPPSDDKQPQQPDKKATACEMKADIEKKLKEWEKNNPGSRVGFDAESRKFQAGLEEAKQDCP